MGLLAMTEAQNSDFKRLIETANEEDLEAYAKQLYSDNPSNLSAYERLLNSDKEKKMDYLNNIRDENAQADDLLHTLPARERSNSIPDISSDPRDDLPDPTGASIREKVLRESQRRQNAITDEKKLEAEQRKELQRLEAERLRREEEEALLTPEEKDQKRLEAKWKREFERQQHEKEE